MTERKKKQELGTIKSKFLEVMADRKAKARRKEG
jgi:hypothetical protein